MVKYILLIIINNIVSITIYICISVVLIPLNIMWQNGIWDDRIWSLGAKAILSNVVLVSFHTTVSMFLFYLSGKWFLINMHNTILNALSIVFMHIFIAMVLYLSYNNPHANNVVGILAVPIHPISETLSFVLYVKIKNCYLITPLCASLVLWIGASLKKA